MLATLATTSRRTDDRNCCIHNSPLNYTDPTGTTQAGNPLTNLNAYGGGYTGGTVANPKFVNPYIASANKGSLSLGTLGKALGNSIFNAAPSYVSPNTRAAIGTGASLVGAGLTSAPIVSLIRRLNSAKRSQNDTQYVTTGQALRDSGGYLNGVGEVVKGYGDAVVDTASGLYNVARHPINTAQGVATAVRHPILTGQVIYNDIYDKSQTLRGQGSLVGDGLIGLASGGIAKAVKEAGLVGKITSKLGKFTDDIPGTISLSDVPFDAKYRARLGVASSNDYRSTFFNAYPDLEGKVVVHHAVEQQALKRYPKVLTDAEIHSLENLRGVPLRLNSELHLTKIRKEWNDFYRLNSTPTKQDILHKATQIDFKHGKEFNPPVGRVGL